MHDIGDSTPEAWPPDMKGQQFPVGRRVHIYRDREIWLEDYVAYIEEDGVHSCEEDTY